MAESSEAAPPPGGFTDAKTAGVCSPIARKGPNRTGSLDWLSGPAHSQLTRAAWLTAESLEGAEHCSRPPPSGQAPER